MVGNTFVASMMAKESDVASMKAGDSGVAAMSWRDSRMVATCTDINEGSTTLDASLVRPEMNQVAKMVQADSISVSLSSKSPLPPLLPP